MHTEAAVKQEAKSVTPAKKADQLKKGTAKSLMAPASEERFEAALVEMPPADRKAMFDGLGKDLARVAGAQALASMLQKCGLSGREIDAQFGYDHAALSRTANGKSVSGPTLWRLFALAEALGFDIELKVTAKR